MNTLTAANRRHRLGCLGLALVLVGILSYFLFFYRFPSTRDLPWLNLLIIGLGVAFAWKGFRAGRPQAPAWRPGLRSLLFFVSLSLSGLFVYYIFYLSYQIPPPSAVTTSLKTPAGFVLRNHQNRPVALSDFRGRPLIISFYRGHW